MNAIFVSVRTGSSRLPGKALRQVGKKKSIEHVIQRAKQSREAQKVILCTTEYPEDDILCKIARQENIYYFRGSAEDKLSRWNDAATIFGVDFFVTCDGDDLLCEPELVDMAFQQHERTGADFIEAKNVPCGAFTYGISAKALQKVCDIKDTEDTEMMSQYFTDTGLFQVEQLRNIPDIYKRPEIRITLDYEDDLKFFEVIFSKFQRYTSLRNIIPYLDEHPEILEINRYCQQKYLDNQKAKTKLKLR